MDSVPHAQGPAVAAAPAKHAASAASVPDVELRGGGSARAGSYVYDGPALDTGWHTHELHQLEYATSGSVGVASRSAHFVCPPHQALWISAGTEHRSMLGRARTVSVFFTSAFAPAIRGSGVRVLEVTPLLREMVLYAARWRIDRPSTDAVAEAFFASMAALLPQWIEADSPWSLPVTKHPVAAAAMDFTLAHLADATPQRVARAVGVSERSLRRLFASEVGMPWRCICVAPDCCAR